MTDTVHRVLITCPRTGLAVHTVLRLRSSALSALNGEYAFRCGRCGEVHAWSRQDAWLERSDQRPGSTAIPSASEKPPPAP